MRKRQDAAPEACGAQGDRRDESLSNDPAWSDCDRQNADSHLRALLLGHSLSLQIQKAGWC